MGNQHLLLPIIFHTAFDNRLPHKHLTTFLHATMNLVKKSKYQKVQFAILKVAIHTVEKLRSVKFEVAICKVENCDLSSKPKPNCLKFGTRQIFHLLTQNMITTFKFCARAIFSLLEKTHPPGSQNLSLRNLFHYSTL
jgi:hypothetical protein